MVNLTSLDLSYSENCTNEGFQSLITSPYITNLNSLNLSHSNLYTYAREGIEMLKSCNHFDECCEINVDE